MIAGGLRSYPERTITSCTYHSTYTCALYVRTNLGRPTFRTSPKCRNSVAYVLRTYLRRHAYAIHPVQPPVTYGPHWPSTLLSRPTSSQGLVMCARAPPMTYVTTYVLAHHL
jgi:hypothetical protein